MGCSMGLQNQESLAGHTCSHRCRHQQYHSLSPSTNNIDQVPLNGNYPARLAVEQLYGYMVRNGKAYGVLTTMKGWCFLRRVNGGGLYITLMFGGGCGTVIRRRVYRSLS